MHISACARLPSYCTEKLIVMYGNRFADEENLFLSAADKKLNLVMTKIDKVPF